MTTATKPARAGAKEAGPARKPYTITEVGLLFDADTDMSISEWDELGKYLVKIEKGISWLIGDWCNHGEGKYGEQYSQAMEATGLAYDTLKNYRCVAAKFDTNRRRRALSFTHHVLVAFMPMPDQNAWLDMAEKESLSVADLRYRIAGGTVQGGVGTGNIMNSGGGGGPGNGAGKTKPPYERGQEAWRQMTSLERKQFIGFIETSELEVDS